MTEDTSLREKTLRDEIPEDVMRLAREALAQEYVNEYPSYADLALRGTGSFTLCSIHAVARSIMSAREAKSRRIEALEAAQNDDWFPIDSAPKDGTVIDLWHEEFGRQPDCYWGKPHHCCGEAGRYCDSDWHGDPEGWVDSTFNAFVDEFTFDHLTHWRKKPQAPGAALSGKDGQS